MISVVFIIGPRKHLSLVLHGTAKCEYLMMALPIKRVLKDTL